MQISNRIEGANLDCVGVHSWQARMYAELGLALKSWFLRIHFILNRERGEDI